MRTDLSRDDGVTMIEVVVSLTLMAVLMTIFTTSVISVYRNVNLTETLSTAQAQLNTAFLRLDKDVRYASGISRPDALGHSYYVEYLNTSSGTEICTQLRFGATTGLLQRRTWNRGVTPITPTGWVVLASNLGTDSGGSPFRRVAAGPAAVGTGESNFQQLEINLTVKGRNNPRIAELKITFTALNTTRATTSQDICVEGRSVA
jgi:prepilin-type N-terminal cleavage/methylation domain-containing protein